jgi:hypothetical protein
MGKSTGMILDNGMSNLELVWRTRSGVSGRTRREYLDFVIDGKSLQDLLDPGEMIGCLGWQSSTEEQVLIDQLLLKRPSPIGDDRVPIYICPECGQLDCGAVTVQIQKSKSGIVWSNLGFQKDNSVAVSFDRAYASIAGYTFDKSEYWTTFSTRLEDIS